MWPSPTEPRFNQAFVEFAQARGLAIDAARVRTPTDKPRVARNVAFVQSSFFAGEEFVDLTDAQRRAEQWCATTAGLRNHGTTQCRPGEVFALERATEKEPPAEASPPTAPAGRFARDPDHIAVAGQLPLDDTAGGAA